MKIAHVFLVFLIALSVVSVSAGNDFFDGNEHFNNGEYEKAIESYQRAIASEGYSFAKLFNLGMTHKRNGSNGLALLHFERAKLINPSKKVLSQINEIRNKLGSQVDSSFMEQSQSKIAKLWLAVACIAFGNAIFLVALLIIIRKFSKIYISLIGLLATGFILAFMEANKLTTSELSSAIVLNNGAELLASPVSKSPKIGQINEGEYVKASAKNNNFVHIKSKNGLRGWIKNSDIEQIIPPA
ncbi:MAG: SH3 domain-containing protein [Puniceicoccales bacterium]|jgi:tetratricopeptide (TPR) repeat protein|nr:SH3 domain-containing protein [Puniceicoccales bacterium]